MEAQTFDFFIGIDWATQAHQVTVVSPTGQILAKKSVEHTGPAIARLIDWLLQLADGQVARLAVAIETPRGALVEMLVQRGLAVFSINPKQLDRFRDRHTVAGAKDDRLDAYVLGDSLRTDLALFRRVKLDEPLIIELRELSRIDEDLKQEKLRLTNRLREQTYRYFPQLLRLCPALDEPWVWDLIEAVPTPAAAQLARPQRIAKVLRTHRIRRLSPEDVLSELRTTPVRVAPGTMEAARAHIRILLPRLRLVEAQLKEITKGIEAVLEQLGANEQSEGHKHEHRDAEIILSVPGIGITIAATMLGEASQAVAERDYDAIRAHAGVAPVTRRSGKRKLVTQRYACNPRLANALYHAARVHAQCDTVAQAHYAKLRQQGHSHGRALRSVADRLLRILMAMLRDGTLYDCTKPRLAATTDQLAQAA